MEDSSSFGPNLIMSPTVGGFSGDFPQDPHHLPPGHEQTQQDNEVEPVQPHPTLMYQSTMKLINKWISKRLVAVKTFEKEVKEKEKEWRTLRAHMDNHTFPADLNRCSLKPFNKYPKCVSNDDLIAAKDDEEQTIYSAKYEMLAVRERVYKKVYDTAVADLNRYLLPEVIVEDASRDLENVTLSTEVLHSIPHMLNNVIIERSLSKAKVPSSQLSQPTAEDTQMDTDQHAVDNVAVLEKKLENMTKTLRKMEGKLSKLQKNGHGQGRGGANQHQPQQARKRSASPGRLKSANTTQGDRRGRSPNARGRSPTPNVKIRGRSPSNKSTGSGRGGQGGRGNGNQSNGNSRKQVNRGG
jgi:hypothetical protein